MAQGLEGKWYDCNILKFLNKDLPRHVCRNRKDNLLREKGTSVGKSGPELVKGQWLSGAWMKRLGRVYTAPLGAHCMMCPVGLGGASSLSFICWSQ